MFLADEDKKHPKTDQTDAHNKNNIRLFLYCKSQFGREYLEVTRFYTPRLVRFFVPPKSRLRFDGAIVSIVLFLCTNFFPLGLPF